MTDTIRGQVLSQLAPTPELSLKRIQWFLANKGIDAENLGHALVAASAKRSRSDVVLYLLEQSTTRNLEISKKFLIHAIKVAAGANLDSLSALLKRATPDSAAVVEAFENALISSRDDCIQHLLDLQTEFTGAQLNRLVKQGTFHGKNEPVKIWLNKGPIDEETRGSCLVEVTRRKDEEMITALVSSGTVSKERYDQVCGIAKDQPQILELLKKNDQGAQTT